MPALSLGDQRIVCENFPWLEGALGQKEETLDTRRERFAQVIRALVVVTSYISDAIEKAGGVIF